jgi:hypothetical protein
LEKAIDAPDAAAGEIDFLRERKERKVAKWAHAQSGAKKEKERRQK